MVFTKIKPELATVTGRVTRETKEKINRLADQHSVSQADIVRVAVECIAEIDPSVFEQADEEGVSVGTYINRCIVGDEE